MDIKKKIIIAIITSLIVIGSSTYLIYAFETKDNQEKIETEEQEEDDSEVESPENKKITPEEQKENNSEIENQENNKVSSEEKIEQPSVNNFPDAENLEKKEENVKRQENDEQPLESYFYFFVISWITAVLIGGFINLGAIKFNTKEPDPYLYLLFVKMVCEIVAYENCMTFKTKDNNEEKYQSVLKFDLNDLQNFLNTFLFEPQTGKDKVRQDAHQIISYYQKCFLWMLLFFYLYFFLAYLLIIGINLIINVYFHGFTKTRSRLKINYLWMFIQQMDELYKKIIAYFLILFIPFANIIFIPKKKKQKYDDVSIERYWLLDKFCYEFEDSINNILKEKYSYDNPKFYTQILLKKDENEIIHHNLDLTKAEDFDDPNDSVKQRKDCFCNEGKKIFIDMKKYFDKNSNFEKNVFQNLKNFIGDNNSEIGDL